MKTVLNVVYDIVKGAGEKNLSIYAAGGAFYVILSAVPISNIYSSNIGMLPAAVIFSMWSAGRGTLCLLKGLNQIHGVVERRGYFRLRIISSFYTVILITGLMISLVNYRFFLANIILGMVFTLLYNYVPNTKISIRKQFYGGCIAALCCTIFSYGFSLYVENYSNYSSYGSIKTGCQGEKRRDR